MLTTAPRPSTSPSASWVMSVPLRLPVALALPVRMVVVRSEAFATVAWFVAAIGPVSTTTGPATLLVRARFAGCGTTELTVEVLPVAVLPPVLAAEAPMLPTTASWVLRSSPTPSIVPSASWWIVVSLSLPDAPAAPVAMVAVPSLLLLRSPLLDASPRRRSWHPPFPTTASLVRLGPAVLLEMLPVAVFPLVLAAAAPMLAATAIWVSMTRPAGSMSWSIPGSPGCPWRAPPPW